MTEPAESAMDPGQDANAVYSLGSSQNESARLQRQAGSSGWTPIPRTLPWRPTSFVTTGWTGSRS
jgi:hypothetical protein